MIKTGIYKITNIVNGKMYIGSAVNIDNRRRIHKYRLRLNKHHSPKLQNSYNKHGLNNFKFETIEECSKENLIVKEQYYIDLYDAVNKGYNCNPVAGSNLGRKWSDEHKKKISNTKKGKPSNRKGVKHTKKSKIKMSKSQKGNSNAKGMKHSEETKQKLREISASKKGRISSRYDSTSIVQYDLQENFIKEWKDRVELKEFGFRVADISEVCRGLQKTAFGFKWKFKQ